MARLGCGVAALFVAACGVASTHPGAIGAEPYDARAALVPVVSLDPCGATVDGEIIH